MRTIAIVCGGDTSEHDVSMRSSAGIKSFLDTERYIIYKEEIHAGKWTALLENGNGLNGLLSAPDETEVTRSEVDRNDFSFLNEKGERVRPDYCYITIPGVPGENGILQGYFDMIRMPYSCCGVLAAALTCSKFVCNRYLSTFGVPVAKSILLHVGDEVTTEACIEELGLPLFVKPNAGGSSYATTKVKSAEELQPAIAAAKNEATGEVIIESFMQGTEITCGCYTSREGLRALPITEVVSKKEFFDVDAKYNGAVEEITPARLSDEMTRKVQEMTKRIYGYIGAKGIIRVDYIIIGDTPHLLEVNTTPGMTATSFIPQEVRAAGLNISDVMDDVIAFGK